MKGLQKSQVNEQIMDDTRPSSDVNIRNYIKYFTLL